MPFPEQWIYRAHKAHPVLGPLMTRFGAQLLNPDLWGKWVTLDSLDFYQASLRIRRPIFIDEWARGGLSPAFFVGASDWLIRSLMAQHLAYGVHRVSILKSQIELEKHPRETVWLRTKITPKDLNEWLWQVQSSGLSEHSWRLLILNLKEKQLGEVELSLRIEGPLSLPSSLKGNQS